jgi:hypothetical protein
MARRMNMPYVTSFKLRRNPFKVGRLIDLVRGRRKRGRPFEDR